MGVALRLAWLGVWITTASAREPAEPGSSAADSGSTAEAAPALVVGGEVPELKVYVGEIVRVTLVDVEGRATAWAVEGGPAGLAVGPDGGLEVEGRLADIGRWRVSLRMWSDGAWSRRAGLDLLIVASEEAVPRARVASDLPRALGLEVGRVRAALPLRGCSVLAGVASGYTRPGQSWVLLGSRGAVSASPFTGVSCDGGRARGFGWSAGIDSAPGVRYVVQERLLRHGLSASLAFGWNEGTWFFGGYGTAGATLLAIGPTVRWTPVQLRSGARQGPELRLAWVPAGSWALEGVLAWTFQLGARPEGPEP